jgi:hypothetical protein
MKKAATFFVLLIILIFCTTLGFGQIPVEVRSGLIYINDGTIGKPTANKYSVLTDSLDNVLKLHPNDTTCLYLRAVLYLRLNNITVNPDLGNKTAFDNLVTAKNMAEKAITNKMRNFNLKVLRAELYKELTNRLIGDQSWKFTANQIAERRSYFNDYKVIANKYYDELIMIDNKNASDYRRLKVDSKYPL